MRPRDVVESVPYTRDSYKVLDPKKIQEDGDPDMYVALLLTIQVQLDRINIDNTTSTVFDLMALRHIAKCAAEAADVAINRR